MRAFNTSMLSQGHIEGPPFETAATREMGGGVESITQLHTDGIKAAIF